MKHYTGQLIEVLLEAYKNASARVSLPAEAHPKPGQYLLINHDSHSDETLPYTFFPALSLPALEQADELLISGDIPSDWAPGIRLAISSPKGRAIRIPSGTQKLALLASAGSSARLLAILGEALSRSIAVVLLCENIPASLPDQVEIRGFSQVQEIVAWSDYLVVDIPYSGEKDTQEMLASLDISKHTNGMVIISGTYPCGALADCGLCSVQTRHKVALACKDGPAFDIAELLS